MRRSNESKTQILTKSSHNQQLLQPPVYESISTKTTTRTLVGTSASTIHGNMQAKTIVLPSATNPFSTIDRNTLDYRLIDTDKQHQSYHTLGTASSNNHHIQQNNILGLRQHVNDTKFTDKFVLSSSSSDLRISNNSEQLNLSNSSIANQLLPNSTIIGIGPTRIHSKPTHIASNTQSNKEINRNYHPNNRNHIITDTLPGPESCV